MMGRAGLSNNTSTVRVHLVPLDVTIIEAPCNGLLAPIIRLIYEFNIFDSNLKNSS